MESTCPSQYFQAAKEKWPPVLETAIEKAIRKLNLLMPVP